jgi:hypothetical protein
MSPEFIMLVEHFRRHCGRFRVFCLHCRGHHIHASVGFEETQVLARTFLFARQATSLSMVASRPRW